MSPLCIAFFPQHLAVTSGLQIPEELLCQLGEGKSTGKHCHKKDPWTSEPPFSAPASSFSLLPGIEIMDRKRKPEELGCWSRVRQDTQRGDSDKPHPFKWGLVSLWRLSVGFLGSPLWTQTRRWCLKETFRSTGLWFQSHRFLHSVKKKTTPTHFLPPPKAALPHLPDSLCSSLQVCHGNKKTAQYQCKTHGWCF